MAIGRDLKTVKAGWFEFTQPGRVTTDLRGERVGVRVPLSEAKLAKGLKDPPPLPTVGLFPRDIQMTGLVPVKGDGPGRHRGTRVIGNVEAPWPPAVEAAPEPKPKKTRKSRKSKGE
jgi:hypothetical protein